MMLPKTSGASSPAAVSKTITTSAPPSNCSRMFSTSRGTIERQGGVQLRRALVVGEPEAKGFKREQQVAEQDGRVEVEIADRAHRYLGGEPGCATQRRD